MLTNALIGALLFRHPPGDPGAILLGVTLLTLGVGALVGLCLMTVIVDKSRPR